MAKQPTLVWDDAPSSTPTKPVKLIFDDEFKPASSTVPSKPPAALAPAKRLGKTRTVSWLGESNLPVVGQYKHPGGSQVSDVISYPAPTKENPGARVFLVPPSAKRKPSSPRDANILNAPTAQTPDFAPMVVEQGPDGSFVRRGSYRPAAAPVQQAAPAQSPAPEQPRISDLMRNRETVEQWKSRRPKEVAELERDYTTYAELKDRNPMLALQFRQSAEEKYAKLQAELGSPDQFISQRRQVDMGMLTPPQLAMQGEDGRTASIQSLRGSDTQGAQASQLGAGVGEQAAQYDDAAARVAAQRGYVSGNAAGRTAQAFGTGVESVAAGAARLLPGADQDLLNEVSRNQASFQQAAGEQAGGGWLNAGVERAGQGIAQSYGVVAPGAALGAVTGGAATGMALTAGLSQYGQAYQQATDAGLRGSDREQFATINAAAESLMSLAFTKLLKMPGLEGAFAKGGLNAETVKGVLWKAAQTTGRSGLEELPEEFFTALVQNVNARQKVDPNRKLMTGDELFDIAVQSMGAAGGARAIGIAPSIPGEISKANVIRGNAKAYVETPNGPADWAKSHPMAAEEIAAVVQEGKPVSRAMMEANSLPTMDSVKRSKWAADVFDAVVANSRADAAKKQEVPQDLLDEFHQVDRENLVNEAINGPQSPVASQEQDTGSAGLTSIQPELIAAERASQVKEAMRRRQPLLAEEIKSGKHDASIIEGIKDSRAAAQSKSVTFPNPVTKWSNVEPGDMVSYGGRPWIVKTRSESGSRFDLRDENGNVVENIDRRQLQGFQKTPKGGEPRPDSQPSDIMPEAASQPKAIPPLKSLKNRTPKNASQPNLAELTSPEQPAPAAQPQAEVPQAQQAEAGEPAPAPTRSLKKPALTQGQQIRVISRAYPGTDIKPVAGEQGRYTVTLPNGKFLTVLYTPEVVEGPANRERLRQSLEARSGRPVTEAELDNATVTGFWRVSDGKGFETDGQGLVRILDSLGEGQATATALHEARHSLVSMGLMTEAEFDALAMEAARKSGQKPKTIADAEEMIAALAEKGDLGARGFIQTIRDIINRFMAAITGDRWKPNAQTATKRIQSGKVLRRAGKTESRREAAGRLSAEVSGDVRYSAEMSNPLQAEPVDLSKFGWREQDDDYIYHVTSKPSADRIAKGGFGRGKSMFTAGSYPAYSKGKTFFTDRSGVKYWEDRVEQQLFHSHDDPPDVAVVRIPKSLVADMLQDDKTGTDDANHNAYYIDTNKLTAAQKKAAGGGAADAEVGGDVRYSAELAGAKPDDAKDKAAAAKAWREQGVESPWFKRWFGKSKVVDAEGKPLVVYHGTSERNLNEFKSGRKSSRMLMFAEFPVETQGHFFSESESDAESYGRNVVPAYVRIEKPFVPFSENELSSKTPDKNKKIWNDYEYILEPLIEKQDGKDVIDLMGEVFVRVTPESRESGEWVDKVAGDALHWSIFDNAEVVKRMRERGYDGAKVWEPNDQSGQSWFAVDSNQIKSATANTGTFDPDNADIRYSADPSQAKKERAASLANPGMSPDVRNQIDAERLAMDAPETQPLAEVQRLADAITPDQVRAALASGKPITAPEMEAARRLKESVTRNALVNRTAANLAESAKVIAQYDLIGTESARAFNIRRDRVETPFQRNQRLLGDELIGAPKSIRDAIKDALRLSREALLKGDKKTAKAERDRATKLSRDGARMAEKNRAFLERIGLLPKDGDEAAWNEIFGNDIKSFRLLREASALNQGYGSAIMEYWNSLLLSGPATQFRNLLGTPLNYSIEAFIERPILAAARVAIGKQSAGDTLRAANEWWKGFSLSGAWRHAVDSYRQETSTFDRLFKDEDYGGLLENMDGYYSIRGLKGRVIRGLGWGPLRAADQFWKALIGGMEVGRFAYAQARSELGSNAKSEDISNRMAEIMADYQSDAWEKASARSDIATFTEKGSETRHQVKQRVKALRNVVPGAKFIIPFIDTPVNIAAQTIERAPALGAIRYLFKMRDNIKNKRPTFDGLGEAAVKQLVSTAALTALLQSGLLSDDDDKYFAIRSGQHADPLKRYTFKWGDTDLSYQGLEPVASLLSLMADWNASRRSGVNPGTVIVGSTIDQIANKPMLQGLGDILQIMNPRDYGTADSKWKTMEANGLNYAKNFGASWVPAIYKQTVKALRPNAVNTRIMATDAEGKDKWTLAGKRMVEQAEIGWMLEKAGFKDPPAAQIDVFGKQKSNVILDGQSWWSNPGTDFLYRLTSPLRTTEQNAHPANELLAAWNRTKPEGAEDYKLSAVEPRYTDSKGKPSVMDEHQFEQLQRLAGGIADKLYAKGKFDPKNPTESQVAMLTERLLPAAKEEARRLVVDSIVTGKPVTETIDQIAERVEKKVRVSVFNAASEKVKRTMNKGEVDWQRDRRVEKSLKKREVAREQREKLRE